MTTFRFRAAAALELRRRQETALATALAAAEGHLRAAEADLAAAATARRAAQDRASALERQGSDATTLAWHRNWIVRLTNDLADRRTDVDRRALDVRRARGEWQQGRRKRLALERMRERAWRRFTADQQRRELIAIDELARLRYVMPDVWREDT